MTKSRNVGRGGKRPGAGRPPKIRQPPAELLDPELVLRQIASDSAQPASARVQAARALITARGKPTEADATAARALDADRRALEILNKGRLN